MLSMGATVTVVTGSTTDAVLRAFGADPTRPESLRAIDEEVTETMSLDPWVAVLDAGTAVLAVEYNGWKGTDESVLCRASADGRAASMYWNGGKGMTLRSFAEGGRLLASFERLHELEDADIEPSVAAALEGLDSGDSRHWVHTGMVAVERFTGYGVLPLFFRGLCLSIRVQRFLLLSDSHEGEPMPPGCAAYGFLPSWKRCRWGTLRA
jgi:hypothetical protein